MEYTCIFCKQSYQSDGSKKPKSYRKDGTVYQYYDSKLFCSKECCIKNREIKRSNTLKNNPEIIKKSREKYKNTIKNNPEIMKQARIKQKTTYKNNPEIIKKMIEKRNITYQNNPEIIERIKNSLKTTYQNHPEIHKKIQEKRNITFKNNPEIMKQLVEKRNKTYKNNPEILINKGLKHKQTLKNNPEIIERIKNSLKTTYQNHPEIIENSRNKAYQTAKNNGFVSKEEETMIRLLKEKYGEDNIIEQYRDPRYKKPNSNYKYSCDCYIKSLDLFIEFNGSRFHPKEEDIPKLEEELKRFKEKYPNKDIKECQAYQLLKTIETDKIKERVAKDNNLNYLIVTDGFKELDKLDNLIKF